MRKTILLSLLCSSSLFAWAQQAIPVKGTVKDKENNPIVGATIVVKGTTDGTKTDQNGNFSISVPTGKLLLITYVGMQRAEVPIKDNSFINLSLVSDSQLDEVVVIGYGTVKKRDLTGAVATVTGKDLQS